MHKFIYKPGFICLLLTLIAGCVNSKPIQTPPTATPNPALNAAPTESLASTIEQAETSPFSQTFMFSDGHGWATTLTQNRFFHTSDRGNSWIEITPPEFSDLLDYPTISPFFLDSQTGWISLSRMEDASLIFHTTDAGSTWRQFKLEIPGGKMYFLDSHQGFMLSSLGAGTGSHYVALYDTTDSGQTWDLRFTHEPGGLDPSLPAGGSKDNFVFLDANIGLLSGSQPVSRSLYLYRTKDGGGSWYKQACDSLPIVNDSDMWMAFQLELTGSSSAILPILAYIEGSEAPVFYFCSSNDSGNTWTYRSTLPELTLSSFSGEQNGLVVSENSLFRTTDGALTWQKLDTFLPENLMPLHLEMFSNQEAFLIATPTDSYAFDKNYLFYTADAGTSWQLLKASTME